MPKKNVNDENLEELNETNQTESELKEEINNEQPASEKLSDEEKIRTLEAEVANYKDLMLRKAAEFENYKRRTENEQVNLLKYAAESLIIKLLPTIDDFERSLSHISEETDVQKIKEGIQLIYNQFLKTLNEQGVQKIESVGKPFNFEYHEALMQRPDDSVPPHTVLDELETGYIYKDHVIRYAKVIVSEE
ncbi:MAG: nucleotide exchange factor GrpE [Ignavibacteriota bacterium]|jgi:molecular chaperone GrpE|nr:MAG: nucleotide exchange factor GrpE [Ignavibacterium sp.]MBL1155711.1 nucleotide exchange factor GrpE [Ignavibacteriota bacterium]MCO6448327.1 nucleotide exchange factor GrpE [Ignavibacterium album]MCZ2268699.1 nucleotide exchange factor GrpE [Ignavibacteriales bacterium]MDX9713116.1 nucleotide exchange factor GrpE [Ignavibacteriaceae bacterium]